MTENSVNIKIQSNLKTKMTEKVDRLKKIQSGLKQSKQCFTLLIVYSLFSIVRETLSLEVY